ncbi:MAG TPA: pyridoxal phosphate-dependent aminotransferase [Synergistaceae bacterium]|nr:pyridoxal phosphate-dependent aminotransferase [Synergistaceae bacterium]
MKIATRVEQLAGEGAFEVLSRVEALQAQGKHIISFAIGEPDFDTEDRIKEAACQALRQGATHYTPSAGTRRFREAAARYISRTRKVEVSPDCVIAAPGVKPLLFYSILTCVDEGDEVLLPSPGFPTYESLVRYAGGVPVRLPLREELDFSFSPREMEELVSPKTKMIILNSPHNPTGGVLEREALEAAARISRERDIWVLSDEVYSAMVYEGEYQSYFSLEDVRDRTILVEGFSKTWAMTGWRLGLAVVPQKLVSPFSRLIINSVSCTAAFTQEAGIAALEGPRDYVEHMMKSYEKRRRLLTEGLQAIPGIRCSLPKGAFYVYANVTELCEKKNCPHAEALQHKLLEEAGVAVLGRSCFGAPYPGEKEEYLRFCYATSEENLREGLRRIREFASW